MGKGLCDVDTNENSRDGCGSIRRFHAKSSYTRRFNKKTVPQVDTVSIYVPSDFTMSEIFRCQCRHRVDSLRRLRRCSAVSTVCYCWEADATSLSIYTLQSTLYSTSLSVDYNDIYMTASRTEVRP